VLEAELVTGETRVNKTQSLPSGSSQTSGQDSEQKYAILILYRNKFIYVRDRKK
jgi:hypothetical protein